MARLGGALLAGLLALLMVGSPDSGWCQDANPFMRVGAWNIEWLGMPDNRSGPAHKIAQKQEDIADYIMASKVDVLALQEIGDDDGDDNTQTNTTLTAAFKTIKDKTGEEWKYVLFPKGDNNKLTQLTGLAWNTKKIKAVGDPFKIPVPNKVGNTEIWARHPHAVKLSFGEGKTDVVFISIHMKSNRGGVAKAKEKRRLEAKTLMADLDKVRDKFTDKDIVILGDSNMLKTDEPAGQIFADNDLNDLNFLDTRTTWHGNASFDRIFHPTDETHNKEFATSKLGVFDDAYLLPKNMTRLDFKKKLSDHFMVLTRVAIMADDD